MKTVTIDPNNPNSVILPGGSRLTRERAHAEGYDVYSGAAFAEQSGLTGAESLDFAARFDAAAKQHGVKLSQREHLAAVLSLPEARERPAAAAELGASFNPSTMSLEAAAAMLRGLPTERTETMTTKASAVDVATFRRRADLRIAALSFNASHGNEAARKEATKLSYAMRIYDAGGVSLADSLTGAGLDARSTIKTILGVR